MAMRKDGQFRKAEKETSKRIDNYRSGDIQKYQTLEK
jgi:hypothetical protein